MNGINIVGVQFRRAGKIYDFDAKDFRLSIGDRVVVETERGPSLAEVKRVAYVVVTDPAESLKPIVRIASRKDKDSSGRLTPEFAETFTKSKIKDLNLEMRVISVEIQFGGNKVIVYFSAPGRVDFRELVKELAGGLKTRVELKQVGARDEAKLSGGIGICGREFCCSSFLREFVPVSIKMAKNQNLALNPSKVSGGCGRLLCCLTYEDDTYSALRQKLLPKGARVRLPDESYGDVIKGDILNQTMLVELDSGEQRSIPINDLEVVDARQGVVDDDWGSDLDFGSLMGEGDITALDDSEEVAQQRESAAEPIQGREGPRKPQPQERGPRRDNNRSDRGPQLKPKAREAGQAAARPLPAQNQNKKQAKPNPQPGKPQAPAGDRPKIAPKIIPRGLVENKEGGDNSPGDVVGESDSVDSGSGHTRVGKGSGRVSNGNTGHARDGESDSSEVESGDESDSADAGRGNTRVVGKGSGRVSIGNTGTTHAGENDSGDGESGNINGDVNDSANTRGVGKGSARGGSSPGEVGHSMTRAGKNDSSDRGSGNTHAGESDTSDTQGSAETGNGNTRVIGKGPGRVNEPVDAGNKLSDKDRGNASGEGED